MKQVVLRGKRFGSGNSLNRRQLNPTLHGLGTQVSLKPDDCEALLPPLQT